MYVTCFIYTVKIGYKMRFCSWCHRHVTVCLCHHFGGVKRSLDYKPGHWFIVRYNAANNMDLTLRHAPNILNTELHSSQKQSKTTSSVGLETIKLSDLIISKDLPPDVLARYKYKIINVGQNPYTMLPEIWVNYDNASIYLEVRYPDIYNYLISAPPPYTGD